MTRWGSTRIAVIAHLGDLICAVHYVCPGIGRITLTDELTAFSNQTAAFQNARRAFIFAGETYGDVLTELETSVSQADGKLLSYGDAYRCLRLPVHLLSCDDTGAVQIQIMAPDYHRRIDAAVAARRDGVRQIAIAALAGQAETVLSPRYRDTGKAQVFILTGEAISVVTGKPPVPYKPSRTPFLSAKGDVIDAPPIQAPGRTGRQAGSKVRPVV